MTIWTQADYDRTDGQDADQVTAGPESLRAEHGYGKADAWHATEHLAAVGHSADAIEQRHMEFNGPTADEHQRTPAESAWHKGYDTGADGSVSLLRDLERADEAVRAREREHEQEMEAAG